MSEARSNRRMIAAASMVAAGALLLAACSSPTVHKKKAIPTTTTTKPAVVCPLTGSPAPGGVVPPRTALAVKVDNYSAARPQSGLDKTDIIFEEPVEGGITRFVAVFQCQDAASIGPVRSARQIDIGILGQLGNPPLSHVGGIGPVLDNINASGIPNLDLGNYAQALTHPAGRYAPYDTYTSTAALYALVPKLTTPPSPIYTYSKSAPSAAVPVSSIHVPFSSQADITWNWSSTTNAWMRFYDGTQPDMGADGVQNQAANVIVQTIQVTYGPWAENDQGGLEVMTTLSGTSGPAMIFRNGSQINGTWSRASNSSPTIYKDAAGNVISMNPGRTWVELLPSTATAISTLAPTTTTAPTPTTAKG